MAQPIENNKSLPKRVPFVGSVIDWLYAITKPFNKNTTYYWINRYLKNQRMLVVQVGSNDGVSGDPLHRLIRKNNYWQVIFVEPVPYLFAKLKQNYGPESRFIFENAAINEDGKKQTFYSVAESAFRNVPGLSPLYAQIGSFDKEHLLKLSDGVLSEHIIENDVECLSINQLLDKHAITSVQFLHIDAEGYDWKIMSQLNFSKIKPQLILFEYINLEENEKREAIQLLSQNYYILCFRIDYLCIEKNLIKQKDLHWLRRSGRFNTSRVLKNS